MTGGNRQRQRLAGSCMAFGLEGGSAEGGLPGSEQIQEVGLPQSLGIVQRVSHRRKQAQRHHFVITG